MNHLHGIRAQLRGIGHCALVGTLVGMLATQSFAATGSSLQSELSTQPNASAVPAAHGTLTRGPAASANLPLASSSSSLELNALPQAPEPIETATANQPPSLDPIVSEAAQDGQSLRSSTSRSKDHAVQRPGMLVLGIVGAAAVVMGAYIFSIKTSATGQRDALGTMFLAPGAAAAGLGFYFAFHKKN